MKKKWLSELKRGELFSTTPYVIDLSQYYIKLSDETEIDMYGCLVCRKLFERDTWLTIHNMQVYTYGIIYKNIKEYEKRNNYKKWVQNTHRPTRNSCKW